MPIPLRKIRILLVQAREHEAEIEHEYRAFREATGLFSVEHFTRVNLVTQTPRLDPGDDAIIMAGSPFSAKAVLKGTTAMRHVLDQARTKSIPVFGVCLGAQLLAEHFGGEVQLNGGRGEHGTSVVRITYEAKDHPAFNHLPVAFDAQQSHDDHISRLPPGAVQLAENGQCSFQAFCLENWRIMGTQFHPERDREWYASVLANPRGLPPETIARYTEMLQRMRPSPHAAQILKRFVDMVKRIDRPS